MTIQKTLVNTVVGSLKGWKLSLTGRERISKRRMSMLRPLYERFEPSDLTLVALIKEEASQLLRAGVASVELLLRSNGRDGHKICSSVWQKFGYIRVHDHKRKIFLKNLIACSACLMVFNYKSRSLGTSQFRRHICHGNFQYLLSNILCTVLKLLIKLNPPEIPIY